MNKDQDVMKEIAEEFKTLAKQMNIEIVTSSYMLNEIEYYLKENNMEMIVAQSNKILGESSFTAVY
jgi:hypothetical protein